MVVRVGHLLSSFILYPVGTRSVTCTIVLSDKTTPRRPPLTLTKGRPRVTGPSTLDY